MKGKIITTIIIMILLTFTFMVPLVPVPTVSATTLKYFHIIFAKGWPTPNPDPRHINDEPEYVDGVPYWGYWAGPITKGPGEELIAWSYFSGTEGGFYVGKVAHFREDFYIVFMDGSWIMGAHDGIWNVGKEQGKQGYYRTVGRITDASPDKKNYIGLRWEEQGWTSWDWSHIGFGIGVGFCWIKSP